MKDFEPRVFQREVIERITVKELREIQIPRPRGKMTYGIDLAEKDGDMNVIATMQTDEKGGITRVWFDEYATLPDYKWYRNPIKWWKWRKMMKTIQKSIDNS